MLGLFQVRWITHGRVFNPPAGHILFFCLFFVLFFCSKLKTSLHVTKDNYSKDISISIINQTCVLCVWRMGVRTHYRASVRARHCLTWACCLSWAKAFMSRYHQGQGSNLEISEPCQPAQGRRAAGTPGPATRENLDRRAGVPAGGRTWDVLGARIKPGAETQKHRDKGRRDAYGRYQTRELRQACSRTGHRTYLDEPDVLGARERNCAPASRWRETATPGK